MIRSILTSVFAGALLLSTGCAGTFDSKGVKVGTVQAPTPVTPTIDVPPQLPPGVAATHDFQVTLPISWLVRTTGLQEKGGIKNDLQASSPDLVGSSHVIVSVISTSSAGNSHEFIKSYLVEMQDNPEVKLIDGTKTKLPSGEDAVLILTLRKLRDDSVVAAAEIVTGNESRGYVLTCAGDPEEVEAFGPTCLEVLQSFRLK